MSFVHSLRDRLDFALSREHAVSVNQDEYASRRQEVAAKLRRRGADVFVGFSRGTTKYLTRYDGADTERPIASMVFSDGRAAMLVSRLRAPNAARQSIDCEIVEYPEYPSGRHPMMFLAEHLESRGTSVAILDAISYHSDHGYHGPSLGKLMEVDLAVEANFVEELRVTKSACELDLIERASQWATLAHTYLHDELTDGLSESRVSGMATGHAMAAMRRRYANTTDIAWPLSVSAGFGGQIGPIGTGQHIRTQIDPVIRSGDLVITSVYANVGGYYSDIERTMIVGAPTADIRALHQIGCELHLEALELIRPGVRCDEIDLALTRRYESYGIQEERRHRPGHSFGVLTREAPYLDEGDPTVLRPGMVFMVEPGVYRDGVGGFRHSDCVVVTETGSSVLTPYPHDIDSLTVG